MLRNTDFFTFFEGYKKFHLDVISVSMSDTIQNFNSESIITIKSNLGELSFLDFYYINTQGEYVLCEIETALHENRNLASHLRTYLFFVNTIESCFQKSVFSKLSLKLNCSKISKTFSFYCSNKKEEIVEIFFPSFKSDIPNNYDKKIIHIVMPYVSLSNYYSGIIPDNITPAFLY